MAVDKVLVHKLSSHVLKPIPSSLVFNVELDKNGAAVVDIGEEELLGLLVLQVHLEDIFESLVRQRDEADNK